MYLWASPLLLVQLLLICVGPSHARLPNVWLGGGEGNLQSALSNGSCHDTCKEESKKAGNTFPGLGTVVGTAPFCGATCHEDCTGRICKGDWRDGKKCNTGQKVCCCAATEWSRPHEPDVFSPESFPVGVLMTRTLFKESLSQLQKDTIKKQLLTLLNAQLPQRNMNFPTEESRPSDQIWINISGGQKGHFLITKLDVGGVMMDAQGHDEIGFAIQVSVQVKASLMAHMFYKRCYAQVRLIIPDMMIFVHVRLTNSRNDDTHLTPIYEIDPYATAGDFNIDVDEVKEQESGLCDDIHVVATELSGPVLDGISGTVRGMKNDVAAAVHKAVKPMLDFDIDGFVVEAKTRMLGYNARSLWTMVKMTYMKPSPKCTGWTSKNSCAGRIVSELERGGGGPNMALMLHDWQVGNLLCELAQRKSSVVSWELGSALSTVFWSLVGPLDSRFESPVSMKPVIAADPEPKMVTSGEKSLLHLPVGLSFKGTEKKTQKEVNLCTLTVEVVCQIGFSITSGKLTPQIKLNEVGSVKVVDSKVGKLVAYKLLLAGIAQILNLLGPQFNSFIEDEIPSFQLPTFLSLSDTKLLAYNKCLFVTTKAAIDFERLFTTVLEPLATQVPLPASPEPDSQPDAGTDSPTVAPVPSLLAIPPLHSWESEPKESSTHLAAVRSFV
uniref:Lipid-binding serum glycoprotein C-terminal domain-containing protein n=1 Tax=Chromera velia CCMP2878 TaxID=1169474 RepID=A0A0G4HBU7_9ALVE|eukprot:Cvel_25921.t1-p1 / transcript=Cvel_25921.t1 / gene=Cvel_25921 / organism=Chromera_velia_CCMP2878 / gene_product=hypothetical protein / transcript_product=hypothetical protein / location=Cvel_scaffold2998:1997-3991(-) / protein_length=665 / sequence_SO=supercontig / SO=protein_coding / is_pseudo=false